MTEHPDHNEPPTNGGRSSFSHNSPEVGHGGIDHPEVGSAGSGRTPREWPADTQPNHTHNGTTRRSPAVEALRKSPVTVTIASVTVLVWLTQFVPGWHVQERLAFVPLWALDEPWRFATTMLVHSQPSPTHVLFNMMGLLIFGTFLERALGSVFFAVTYVLSGVGGSAMVWLLAMEGIAHPFALYVGASGAVFGLVGVLLVPSKRLDRNWGGVAGFVLLNVLMLFVEPNIAWEAHLGGLIVGFVLGAIRLWTMKPNAAAPWYTT
ncbi:rhomboid family intramembrane serine protease [Brevibacterium sp. UMB10442]|nr:rhomboid family intramembrane serine protease [Brevibacterium sp. UMB10442]